MSKPLKEGEPCSHKGCLNHVTHPCEVCGRIGGKHTLEQVQKFNRKAIIMAVHPECKTLEEALEKELEFGCEINFCKSIVAEDENSCKAYLKQGFIYIIHKVFPIYDSHVFFAETDRQFTKLRNERLGNLKIIGLPNTLSRVLYAIREKNKWLFVKRWRDVEPISEEYDMNINLSRILYNWKYSTSCLLEHQSEDTQRAVAKLLGVEGVCMHL